MPDDIELDFQAALRVARISIPADRYAIMLDAYRSHRDLMAVLDEPLPYAVEMAANLHPVPSPSR